MHGFNWQRTWMVVRVAVWLSAMALLLPSTVFAQQSAPPSALDPASPAAAAIADLHSIVLIIAIGVFVVVEGLILYAAFRFRRRRHDDGAEPPQTHGNTRLEIAWTVAPALIVVTLFVLTLRTQATIDAAGQDTQGAPLTVQVIGHQWWWEYRYPELRITTASDLVIPIGRVVHLEILSADVNHSFWIPQLNGKTDAIPGVINKTWIEADATGQYSGQCAELCGASHANMRMIVTAKSPAEFDAWARAQALPAAEPAEDLAREGQQVFTTVGCTACHTIDGLAGAVGKTGPNLTHVSSRPCIAGCMLGNTPYNQARWLENPPAVKPGALMPNLNLTRDQIEKLVAYLQTLR